MEIAKMKAMTFVVFGLIGLATLGISFSDTPRLAAQITIPANASPVKVAGDFDQKSAVAKLNDQIKGREGEPAEKVFKNIQLLKGVPAGRVLKIMEIGYSGSLGVNCTHCHVPEKWESEDRNTKQIARDMVAMMGQINGNLLKNIKNLASATPTVNCTTCHRGQTKPSLNILPPTPQTVKQ